MPKLLAIIICGFLIVPLVVFLVFPKYQAVQALRLKTEQTEKELQYREEYFSHLKELSKQLEPYGNNLIKIDSALPTVPSLPALFSFLQKTISENGLILKNISYSFPSKSKSATEIREISFFLSLSGSYSVFKNFLFSLEKSAQLWELKGFSLSAGTTEKTTKEVGGEEPVFSFDLQLGTYSY